LVNQEIHSIRPWVTAFAAISFGLKAALLFLLSVPALLDGPHPSPALLLTLFAGAIAASFARSLLVRRLSADELVVLQFWSITPLLIFLVGGMLGAIPILVLGQMAHQWGWSEAVHRNVAAFFMTGALISAAIVIWASWRQVRASLPSAAACPGSRPDDPAGSSA